MKVLMFGWEFPPFISGGLGPACQGLAKGLVNRGVQVTFVLPRKVPLNVPYLKFVFGDDIDGGKKGSFYVVNSLLPAYNSQMYSNLLHANGGNMAGGVHFYGNSLFEEVHRYGQIAAEIARQESFDIIHAHDWLTIPAAVAAKKASGKPLVLHIHNTVYDRAGGNSPHEYAIEKMGFESADVILAISNFTRQKVIQHYGIPAEKVKVVHNSIDFENYTLEQVHKLKENNKIVLYLGRLTLQKGVDYLISAAKNIVERCPNVLFVIAGGGDMERQLIEQAANLGISDRVIFTGFIHGRDVRRAFQMADLCVMPSVSEPFGLVPLESVMNGTPVLISKQSGVSEVLNHCLKVDFWDVNEMTNKIYAVLQHTELQECLKENSMQEISGWSWNTPAAKCVDVYHQLTGVH